jgi:putative hydrolase of the HAD superfamily
MIRAILFDCAGVFAPKSELLPWRRAQHQRLLELAQSLRVRYKVGMLTSLSARGLDNYFAQPEQARYFDEVVTSDDTAEIKPAPEAFRLACGHLGVQLSEVVMIDDTPANCRAAEALGMQAIAYTNPADLKRKLSDILAKP